MTLREFKEMKLIDIKVKLDLAMEALRAFDWIEFDTDAIPSTSLWLCPWCEVEIISPEEPSVDMHKPDCIKQRAINYGSKQKGL